jgi:hypothetical protein
VIYFSAAGEQAFRHNDGAGCSQQTAGALLCIKAPRAEFFKLPSSPHMTA